MRKEITPASESRTDNSFRVKDFSRNEEGGMRKEITPASESRTDNSFRVKDR